MSVRSLRPDVRNPVLELDGVRELMALPPETRAVIARALHGIVSDSRAKAQKSWRQNKGPMAAYWKAVGAYAEHLRRAVRRPVAALSEQGRDAA